MPKQRNESPKPLKAKRRWLQLFYLLLLTLGLTILLETAVRHLGIAPKLSKIYGNNVTPHPVLPYLPLPNHVFEALADSGEFTCTHRHNSLGFRDAEHEMTKPQDVYRIVGLGDSFTYGIGVEYEDTYLAVLERLLNERGGNHKRVEVVKLGISGYSPESERLVLEEYGIKFSPDLILIGFLANDVIETYCGLDAVKICPNGYLMTVEAKQLGWIGEWLYFNSHAARIVLARYVQYRMERIYNPQWDKLDMDNGPHEKDWQKVEQEYAKMIALAHEHNATTLVVHIPHNAPWYDFDHYPARRLCPFVERLSAYCIDLLPAMKERSTVEKLYYDIDGHCTAAGYKVIAEQLFQIIQDRGWAQ